VTGRLAVPSWVPASSLVLCAGGVAVSGYLTYEHYNASSSLACPETATFNCLKVTTSEWSTFVGIPVALLGLVFFVAMAGWCLPAVWRIGDARVRRGRVAAAVVGVGFALYLIWAELFKVDSICLWCTAAHAISVVLLFVVLLGTAYLEPADGLPAG
jgi:uncharacterized membrane protein